MNRKLFIDFDECIAHTLCADNKQHANQLLDTYSEYWVGEHFIIPPSTWDMTMNMGMYVTFKRSWTDDLLTFCRQLVGNSNVFILTASTREYITICNEVLDLNFPTTQIFSRDDMFVVDKHPKFIDTYNVLVDNLSYKEQCVGVISKVAFLNTLPQEQYIKVKPFNVWREPLGYQEEYIRDLSDRIMTVLNY